MRAELKLYSVGEARKWEIELALSRRRQFPSYQMESPRPPYDSNRVPHCGIQLVRCNPSDSMPHSHHSGQPPGCELWTFATRADTAGRTFHTAANSRLRTEDWCRQCAHPLPVCSTHATKRKPQSAPH